MKKSLLVLLGFFLALTASAQIVDIEVEVYAEHTGMVGDTDLTGYTTYRVYAVTENEGDFLFVCFGTANQPLIIESTESFYQMGAGGNVGSDILDVLYPTIPELEFDSWVTIGRAQQSDDGTAVTTVQAPAEPWVTNFANGEDIVINGQVGGTWFILPEEQAVNGIAGPDSRVLIGQFTTQGEISGIINGRVRVNGLDGEVAEAVGLPFSSVEGAVFGCTDEAADNYDPAANIDDGSCVFPCALVIDDLVLTPTTCSDTNNGSVTILASGAQGGVLYQIDGGSQLATNTQGNLSPGEHSLIVSDAQGCTAQTTFIIPSPDPVAVDLTLDSPISCNGDADAAIAVATSGGTGAILIDSDPNLENAAEISLVEDLGPGQYTYYAIDDNGCTGQSEALTIQQPSAIQVNVSSVFNTTCPDSEDGSLLVASAGGTGALEFSIDGGETFQTQLPINAGQGTYTVIARDENGCTQETNPATIGGPEAIELDLSIINPTCFGDTDGSFNGMALGGNGGFTYTVDDGMEMGMLDMADLAGGVYSVTVVDEDGCTASFDAVLSEPAEVTVEANVTDIACFGEENGLIEAVGAGGTGELSYSLDGGDAQTESTFDDLTADEYTITVEDENGCSASDMFTVVEPDELTVDGTETEESAEGAADGSIDLDVSGGTEGYEFDWSGPNGFSADTEDVDGLEAGQYSVTVTDANGCTATYETEVITNIGELAGGVSFTVSPNPSNGMFFLNINGLNGQKVAYRVLDGSGRVIMNQEVNGTQSELRHEIDLNGVANGMYFLNIQVGENTTTARIIKQQ